MATFITTKAISENLEDIIRSASKNLILLSPYLKFSTRVAESLMVASVKGVQIQMIYGKGKDKLRAGDKKLLSRFKSLKLYYFEELHAKCYFNEEKMIITSMNLLQYSEQNNSEFGLLICRKNDKEIFESAFRESLSIIEKAAIENLTKSNGVQKNARHDNELRNQLFKDSIPFSGTPGHCIRCHQEISYNIKRPFCTECFKEWKEDPDFNEQELFCHTCGEIAETTIKRPECILCYKSEKRQNQ